jgi:putative heme iron utilization protein
MEKLLDLQVKKEKYVQFLSQSKTLVISSMDDSGNPFISYAPYVIHDNRFYIFISKISDHYQYLEKNKVIHIMILADEAKSPNLFARERIRFQCSPDNVGNEDKEQIFEKFVEIHGAPMMGVLRGIDMSLFQLSPIEGRYVVGFGQAFDIDLSGKKFNHVVVDRSNR